MAESLSAGSTAKPALADHVTRLPSPPLEPEHLATIRAALEKCRADLAHLEFGDDCAEVLAVLGGEVR